ncbi:hypothetical protein B0H34DRAFT_709352, partial [Crassisporium funariophilum]
MSACLNETQRNLGAAFLGFTAGSILFGITILQASQYFTAYGNDSRPRKQFISLICLLDAVHLSLSTFMMYSMLLNSIGDPTSGPQVIWSFKALETVQTMMILLVQCFYLYQIWKLAGNFFFMDRNLSRLVKISVCLVLLYIIALTTVFLAYMENSKTILNFSWPFQPIVYLGKASVASIDCTIAVIMSVILFKSGTKSKRSGDVIRSLVLYFVGTGVLTAIAAIVALALYIFRPDTLLYLSIDLIIIRLYANSVLALFNAKTRLRDKMNATLELNIPSALLFGEPAEA